MVERTLSSKLCLLATARHVKRSGGMSYDGSRLLPMEWFCLPLWVVGWGSRAYLAMTEKSIFVVGRLTMGRAQGLGAVWHGRASAPINFT